MGIIIDPSEHSFYSSVLSGFAIENYQSHYWQARFGYPRFYRFVVKDVQQAPRTRTLRASATQVHPASEQASAQQTQRVATSSQKPGVMATVADSSNQPLLRPVSTEKTTVADARQVSSQKPDLTAARPASGQKPAAMTPVADASKAVSRQVPPASTEKAPLAVARPVSVSSQKPAVTTTVADSHVNASAQPAQITADAEARKTVTPDTAIHNEIFVTSQATPSRRDVLAAIIRAADDNGEHLLRGRLLDWQPLVGVVDGFRLISLDVQGNSGLAEVEVTQIAAFRNGKPTSSRLVSTRRVILSRQQQGWVLVTPQELLYLNHHQATAALTDQLAALSKTPADQLQAKKTARILRELTAPKSSAATPAGADLN